MAHAVEEAPHLLAARAHGAGDARPLVKGGGDARVHLCMPCTCMGQLDAHVYACTHCSKAAATPARTMRLSARLRRVAAALPAATC